MNILFIIPWIPYPVESGGAQAFYNMVDEIRKYHEVSVLLTVRVDADEQNIGELKKLWKDVHFYVYDQRKETDYRKFTDELKSVGVKGTTSFLCKWMYKTSKSLQRKINRRVNKYRRKNFKELIKADSTLFEPSHVLPPGFLDFVKKTACQGFDTVQVEFYEYLPLVHLLPKNVHKVFLHHEIRFVHNANELKMMGDASPNGMLLLEDEKGREIYHLSKYDQIMVLTETDKRILQPLLPQSDIYVSPAITMACKKITHTYEYTPIANLVFMGNYFHVPNVEGLIWFCSQVMPILVKRYPGLKLFVTGLWDEQSRKILEDLCDHIVFTGFIEDINQFINGKISIIPIRIGSGMRMKAMDAMISNSPIVSTLKGCEGLNLESGKEILVADTPQDFAVAVTQLLDDKDLGKAMAAAANRFIHTQMNAEAMIKTRLDFYKKIENEQPTISDNSHPSL